MTLRSTLHEEPSGANATILYGVLAWRRRSFCSRESQESWLWGVNAKRNLANNSTMDLIATSGSNKEMFQLEEHFISGKWTPPFLRIASEDNPVPATPLCDSSNVRVVEEPPTKKKRGNSSSKENARNKGVAQKVKQSTKKKEGTKPTKRKGPCTKRAKKERPHGSVIVVSDHGSCYSKASQLPTATTESSEGTANASQMLTATNSEGTANASQMLTATNSEGTANASQTATDSDSSTSQISESDPLLLSITVEMLERDKEGLKTENGKHTEEVQMLKMEQCDIIRRLKGKTRHKSLANSAATNQTPVEPSSGRDDYDCQVNQDDGDFDEDGYMHDPNDYSWNYQERNMPFHRSYNPPSNYNYGPPPDFHCSTSRRPMPHECRSTP